MPPTLATHSDHVSVVQLTDSHLYASAHASLLGLDTHASLHAVIDLLLAEVQGADLVLATGDITQDASPEAYQRFIAAMKRLPAACLWIPGNHDDAGLMAELGDPHGLNQAWADVGNWRIVMLDSSVKGKVAGYLDARQMARLDQALADVGERFVLVCLHHHPVSIGSDWMEPIGLSNAEQLFDRLDACSQVRAVMWGHIHQHLDRQRGNIRLLASPSTCVQFAERSEDFATDDQSPGYRWLRLYNDGRIETAISRLPAGQFTPDPSATGY